MSPQPPRPKSLTVLPDTIPAGIRARLQWVVWKYQFNPEKTTKPWTKVPYNPTLGSKASHSDPTTWGTFQDALGRLQKGGFDGIGYVFYQEDPYCGIDLDECRNPVDGAIDLVMGGYVDQMSSYTEVSPSGTGLHIIIEAKLPKGGRKNKKRGIEIYDQQRFFCFTGQIVEGSPAEPKPRQPELDCFYAEIFGPQNTQSGAIFEPDHSPLTDAEQHILDKARANSKNGEKINLLLDGRFEDAGYNSHSEADLALCNHLAFWFNRDRVTMDKVFRASKLYRKKWDQKHYSNGDTYGQQTIQKAIQAVQEGYRGSTLHNQQRGEEGTDNNDPDDALGGEPFPDDGQQQSRESPPAQEATHLVDREPYDIFGDPALTGKPEWPEDACPRAIDTFARDEAERIGVDTAMVAMQAIGVAAIAIHDGFLIQPKQKDTTWTEPPILWIGVVGDPGQKKSPAQSAAKRPLQELEREFHQSYKAELQEYESDYALYKRSKSDMRPPDKPIQRRISTDDTTVEGLRKVLGENTRGVGIIKDELGSWLASFDVYRNGSKTGSKDRADYCELYQGKPKWVDRADKEPMYVPHWGASIVGNIQPGPVKRLMGNITDDGLIARFMIAHCEKNGRGQDRMPNHLAIGTYLKVIKNLVDLKPTGETETFTFAPEAQEYLEAIWNIAEKRQCLPNTSDALKAHLSKFAGMYCRLALVFHMVEAAAEDRYPSKQISNATARMAAILMSEFLLPNSVRFYAETIDDGSHSSDARWVAGYILSKGLEIISKRELTQAYHAFRREPKAIQATMNTLDAFNWVEEKDHKRSGEVTSWTVNPAVHAKFTRLAQFERERRAAERKKIKEAVKMFRREDA
jgi:hypothetical protein